MAGHIPVIRIELDGMKTAISRMLSEQALNLDEYVKAAIEQECQPAALRARIESAAKVAIGDTVKSAVDQYLRYGAGGSMLRELVTQRLEQVLDEMGLTKKEG